ncbi:hypothetical protein SAY87_002820 [Trapa incisa]|uniref:Uncharacterized protein n=2 Tax=Trapa TaxID=22665 RepID=A0AAN7KBE9_TRANT|nr:hypothetical protein SAY87_002820 [Trapa incisa]KAK4765718.1 hypothetical protein SAY86_026808 [Trapa natans]
MDLAAAGGSDDEWELCNDDGFIYKRKKRHLDPLSAAPPPANSRAEEEKFRRARRKKTLLKIKERYQKELSLWEELSSKCRAMQDSAEQLKQETGGEEEERCETRSSGRPPEGEVPGEENGLEALIDRLLLKVEAQEAIIQDTSNMCDIAESLCRGHEEEFRQSLMDLPIWASPQDLMAVLSDD